MNTLFENVYDIIFAPRIALRRIQEMRPIGQAVLVFLLSILVPSIPMYFTMPLPLAHFAGSLIVGGQLIVSLAMWFMGAAVWGLIAEFLGGTGRSSSLFTALGFTHIPRILLIPGLMAASFLPPVLMQIAEVLLIAVISLWSLVLDIAAIRETYALSGAKSALVFLAPLLIVLLFAIVAAISIGSMMTELPFSFDNVLVE